MTNYNNYIKRFKNISNTYYVPNVDYNLSKDEYNRKGKMSDVLNILIPTQNLTHYYPIIDRSGVIPSQQIIFKPIPNNTSEKLYFEDVIKERALEIKKLSETKEIYLFWSGGIDSTLVFYSLLENNVPFTVIYSDSSIKEYPMLSELIINNYFDNVKYYNQKNYKDFINEVSHNDNIICVTGEIADQLIGSVLILNYEETLRQKPAKEVISPDIYDVCINSILEVLNVPEEEITLSIFFWALNFIFKYQAVLFMKMGTIGLTPIELGGNTIHFFDTIKLQQWALQNYKENLKYTSDIEYKKIYKEYIFKRNGDEEYFKNKRKSRSVSAVYLGLDEYYINTYLIRLNQLKKENNETVEK